MIRKIGQLVVALAVLVAPIASNSCYAWFYEEEEPDEFKAFAKRGK